MTASELQVKLEKIIEGGYGDFDVHTLECTWPSEHVICIGDNKTLIDDFLRKTAAERAARREALSTGPVTPECAVQCVRRLSVMRYFPTHAMDVLAGEIIQFCWDDLHARQMTDRALRDFEEWPSVAGLRGCAGIYRKLRDESR